MYMAVPTHAIADPAHDVKDLTNDPLLSKSSGSFVLECRTCCA